MSCFLTKKPVESVIVGYVKGERSKSKRHTDCVLLEQVKDRALLECEYKLAEVHVSLESTDKYVMIADALLSDNKALVGKSRMVSLQAIRLDDNVKEWQACSEKMVRLAHDGFPKALRTIRLCCNQIKELPLSLFRLESLQCLYLARNHITKVPDDIGRLKELRVLDLSANMLQTLPETIGECKQLRELLVLHNQLRKIPRELGECRELKLLDMRYNTDLKYLPYNLVTKRRHFRVDTEGCSMIKNEGELAALCRVLNLEMPCPSLKELCSLGRKPGLSNRCDKCHRKCNLQLRFKSIIESGVPLIMRVCNSCK